MTHLNSVFITSGSIHLEIIKGVKRYEYYDIAKGAGLSILNATVSLLLNNKGYVSQK